jgi:hypothetical protein
MTRTLRLLLICFLAALLGLSALPADARRPAQTPIEPRFVPGEVLIGWEPGRGPVQTVRPPRNAVQPDTAQSDWQMAVRQVAAETKLPVLDARPDYGTARLKVREGREAEEIRRLQLLPWVRYAEPNYIAFAADAGVTSIPALYPNDPDFDLQWNMHRVAAPEAWALIRGSTSFVVAVLDTGVAQAHEDLKGSLLPGRNYITPGVSPEDDDPDSHGTHVTGIITANINNGIGIAGLAPEVKALPYKVLRANRLGDYGPISQAIRDAANSEAQVINMSLVGYDYSQTLQDAVNYAISRGRLIVAAAGNCAQGGPACQNIANPTAYPAAFPGVLAVGASDRFDQRTPYSGYKPYIGIAAPGGTAERGVWSTTRFGYGYMYGTSISAPMVSAAAALVWTLRPAARPGEIADLLKSTADKVGTHAFSGEPLSYPAGRNDYFGAGRLNVATAVRQAYPPSLIGPGWQSLLAQQGSSQTRTVAVENPSGQGIWWQANVLEGSQWLSVSPQSGTAVFGAPGELTLRVDTGGFGPGSYVGRVRLTPLAPEGMSPVDIPVQLQVAPRVTHTYLPLAGIRFGSGWYDPHSTDALYRMELNLANDGAAALFLPFPVAFYGTAQQLIHVSENGLITLGQGNPPLRPPTYCPGNGAAPNNALYAFAADWVVDGEAVVTIHQPDADSFVITWQDVRLNGSPERSTFQVAISRSGDFQANYLFLANPRAGIIGSENDDGTIAERIQCQGSGRPARQGGSVVFAPRAPWP